MSDIDTAEPIISDGNYEMFNKTPEDFKTIILSTINKILFVNSSLLSNSGKVMMKQGDQVIQVEMNTLKVYYQLIDLLEDLLLHFNDDQAIKELEEQEVKKKNIFPKYLELFIKKTTNFKAKSYAIQNKSIPQTDAIGKWCWDNIEYEERQTYRKKFRSLILLFKRKNDLSGKRYAQY